MSPSALLQAIADLPDDELRQGLAHLQAAEFLYETHLFPDLEYTFKHALTHEVAYAGLLQERRRALHARIVEAVERLIPERLAEQVEWLGSPCLARARCGTRPSATSGARVVKAAARAAGREARTYFEQALAALGHLPRPARRSSAWRSTSDSTLMRRSCSSGRSRTSLERLREAEALADAAGDRDSARVGAIEHHVNLASLGDLAQRSGGWGARGCRPADQRRAATSGRIDTIAPVAVTGSATTARRIEICRGSEPLIEHGPPEQSVRRRSISGVYLRIWRVLCLAELGQFTEAAVWGDQAIREAADDDDSGPAGDDLGIFRRGAAPCGPRDLRAGDRDPGARDADVRGWRPDSVLPPHRVLAWHRLRPHRTRRRGPRALESRRIARGASIQFRYGQPLVLTQLGQALLLRRPSGRGATRSRHPGPRAGPTKRARGSEAYAIHLLGELAALADPPDGTTAEAHYREALSLAEERGMRPLVAHCHLGLGKLYRRTGDRAKAEEHLTTATTMYREMDMGFWLEKAEGALKEAG